MRYALVLVLVVALAGCGRRHAQGPTRLRFEDLPDTAHLSRGEPLLNRIEPYRTRDGALRIRGRVDFPEGTRIQLSIYRKGTNQMVARLEAQVRDHGFETPPILTAR